MNKGQAQKGNWKEKSKDCQKGYVEYSDQTLISNFTHSLYKYSGTYWIAFIFQIYVSIIYLNIAHTLF